MMTMMVKDKFGQEIQQEVHWITDSVSKIWFDYQSTHAGECCKFERTRFLQSQPANYRMTTQRTCLCDICGKAFAASDELSSLYPVPTGKKPQISVFYRLLGRSGSGTLKFVFLHLHSDIDFVTPSDLEAFTTWSEPTACATHSQLQGTNSECVAENFVVLKVSTIAGSVDTAGDINTMAKKTQAIAELFNSLHEWRLVLKIFGPLDATPTTRVYVYTPLLLLRLLRIFKCVSVFTSTLIFLILNSPFLEIHLRFVH